MKKKRKKFKKQRRKLNFFSIKFVYLPFVCLLKMLNNEGIASQRLWNINPLRINDDIDDKSSDYSSTLDETLETKRCSQFTIHIFPNQQHWFSGDIVTGHININCKVSSIKIKTLTIQLECITFYKNLKKVLSIESIYSRSLILLGPNTPPCDLVNSWSGKDSSGFWKANKGRYSLRYALALGHNLPGSFQHKSRGILWRLSVFANLNYGRSIILISTKDLMVSQIFHLSKIPPVVCTFGTNSKTWGFLKNKGKVEIKCNLSENSKITPCGGFAYFRVEISNQSRVRIGEIEAILVQRIKSFTKSRNNVGLSPTGFERRNLTRISFSSKEWDLEDNRKMILPIQIPNNICSIYSSLYEVTYSVEISAISRFCSKVSVELPLIICHPSTLFLNKVDEAYVKEVKDEVVHVLVSQQQDSGIVLTPENNEEEQQNTKLSKNGSVTSKRSNPSNEVMTSSEASEDVWDNMDDMIRRMSINRNK
jgi:hypothetical protein